MSGGRIWTWLGAVLGAVMVSGALVAVLNQAGGSDDADAGDVTTTGPPTDNGRRQWEHEWPASYVGPVWITVDPPDDIPRTVTISWGPWERQILHDGDEPATYVFAKSPTNLGQSTVPTTVEVDPAAIVTFGSGTPPVGAADVNDGWTRTDS